MSKENCWFECIHVKTGALIIGSLILVLGAFGLLASVITFNATGIIVNPLMSWIYSLGVIIGGCIIYADKSYKPGGYLPYLILLATGIVIYSIFIAFFVILAIAVPETLSNYLKKYSYGNYGFGNYGYATQYGDRGIDGLMTTGRGMFLLMAAMMAFIDWIAIWLWMVVYRAYQYMKGVEVYDRGQTY